MTIIIYLIGCILAIILDIKETLKSDDYKLEDLPFTLFMGLISWIGVLIGLITYLDGDTIIFKKKKK